MAKKNRKRQQQNNTTQVATASYLPPDYAKAAQEAKSLIRSIDRKIFKSVPKGVQYDWLNNSAFNNIVYPRDKIPDRLLRLVERRNGIVGAIVTLRIQQAVEFSNISHDKDVPGWEVVLVDQKATPTSAQEKQKEFLENFFMYGHREDYEPIEPSTIPSDMRERITKYVRDRLLIDKITWEVERDREGWASALWVLDGTTILPVLPGGFYGSVSQVGVGISAGFNRLSEEIRKARLASIPPVEEIAYIQELLYGSSGGGITAAFRESDLIYDLGNELNDIRYYKQGLSVTEKANIAIVAFINSLTFNSNGLSRGAIPKIAIAMGRESGYTVEQLEDAQDEWAANFLSMDGQWNIPLLNGEAKVLNLLPTNRDMEYQKYMEFSGALICAEFGVDASEIGLRLNQAQSVLSENQDAKQLFSKNRGVRELLGGYAYINNKFLRSSEFPFAKDWSFRFNGLSTEDKGFEADLRNKDVQYIKTIDEVRASIDLAPLPDGQGKIILNTVFLQAQQATQQQAAMDAQGESGFGGFDDDEIDGAVNDAMSGLEKAVRLI